MTQHQTPAEMAEEIKRLAASLGDMRVMAWRDRATRDEVLAVSAELHAAIDRLRAAADALAATAQAKPDRAADILRRAGDLIEAADGTTVENEKLVDDYRAWLAAAPEGDA